jgi:polygalacturonase
MKPSCLSSLTTILLAMAVTAEAAEQAGQSGCKLTGTYTSSSDLSSCDTITISSLSVPPGVTLDLTKVKNHATINFIGTTTFGTKLWDGPLVLLTGSNLKVSGGGTLDGQGEWYWKQGQSVTRPVFFRLNGVDHSALSGFTLKNSPFRTFSIESSTSTTLSGLTLDSSAGNGLAKNTDGFDLSRNNGVVIINNTIKNQDDCLAMQSSVNTTFSGNTCVGGHGISIGSLGGDVVDVSDTVSGLTVANNIIINSVNGIRIKTIVGLQGLVTGATYTNNVLNNVENAIVIHSDYSKANGGYTGSPTSQVAITHITINGLTGTATNLYDVVTNRNVVSNWKWSRIGVMAKTKGSCVGQPSTVSCA